MLTQMSVLFNHTSMYYYQRFKFSKLVKRAIRIKQLNINIVNNNN